jgi:hypothetical protein
MKIRHKINGTEAVFSPRAARVRRCQKRVKAWAEVIEPVKERIDTRLVMLTLTYRNIEDWAPGQVRSFMLTVKKQLDEKLLAYAWVAELQKRGAVHYHVLLLVKKGTDIPKPDDSGWWEHGLTRIETARSPFYVLTYTGKEYQKVGIFPKGLRMFAVWISPKVVSSVTRWLFRLSAVPAWLVEAVKGDIVGASFKRVIGGGWEVAGVKYVSPWEVIEFG